MEEEKASEQAPPGHLSEIVAFTVEDEGVWF